MTPKVTVCYAEHGKFYILLGIETERDKFMEWVKSNLSSVIDLSIDTYGNKSIKFVLTDPEDDILLSLHFNILLV